MTCDAFVLGGGGVLGAAEVGMARGLLVSHPPDAILRIVNPMLRFLLHTPAMGAARKQLIVASFNGRKTGRQSTIPLSAHRSALVCRPTRKGIRQAC